VLSFSQGSHFFATHCGLLATFSPSRFSLLSVAFPNVDESRVALSSIFVLIPGEETDDLGVFHSLFPPSKGRGIKVPPIHHDFGIPLRFVCWDDY